MATLMDIRTQVYFVNNKLHDQSFNIKEVYYSNGVVTLQFHLKNRKKGQTIRSFRFFDLIKIPVSQHVLKIHYASNFELIDTEGIDCYGFNYLDFLPLKDLVVIHTIPSIKFNIHVSQFSLELKETERVKRWKKEIVFKRIWPKEKG